MPAPSNDNFANRITLAPGGGSRSGDFTKDATIEVDEPVFYNNTDQTIWYEFTPSTDGVYQFTANNVVGSTFPYTILRPQMFTGTAVNALTNGPNVVPNYTWAFNNSSESITWYFLLSAGINYKLQFVSPTYGQAANYFANDSFDLAWSYTYAWPNGTPPANDDHANAIVLSGSGVASGTLYGTTLETIDQNYIGYGSPLGRSAWYKVVSGAEIRQIDLAIVATSGDSGITPYIEVFLTDGTLTDMNIQYYDYLGDGTATPPSKIVAIPPGKTIYIWISTWQWDVGRHAFDLTYTVGPYTGYRYRQPWDSLPLIQDGLIHSIDLNMTNPYSIDTEIWTSIDLSSYTEDEEVFVDFAVYDTEHLMYTQNPNTWRPRLKLIGVNDTDWNVFDPYTGYLKNIPLESRGGGTKWTEWVYNTIKAGVGYPETENKSQTQIFYLNIYISDYYGGTSPGPFRLSYRIAKKGTRITALTPSSSPTVSTSGGWIKDTQIVKASGTGNKFENPWNIEPTFTVNASDFPDGEGVYRLWIETRLSNIYSQFNSWDLAPVYGAAGAFTTAYNPISAGGTFVNKAYTEDSTIYTSGGTARSNGGGSNWASALQTNYAYSLIYGGQSHIVTVAVKPDDGSGLGLIPIAGYSSTYLNVLMFRDDSTVDKIKVMFGSTSSGLSGIAVATFNLPSGILAVGTKLITHIRPASYQSSRIRNITTVKVDIFYDAGAGVVFVGSYTTLPGEMPILLSTAYNHSGFTILSGQLDDWGVKTLDKPSLPDTTQYGIVCKRNGLPLAPSKDYGSTYFAGKITGFIPMTDSDVYFSGPYDVNYLDAQGPSWIPVKSGDVLSFSLFEWDYNVEESLGGEVGNLDIYSNGFWPEIRSIRVAKLPSTTGAEVSLAYCHPLPLGAANNEMLPAGDLAYGDLWQPMTGAPTSDSGRIYSKDICVTSNGKIYCLWEQYKTPKFAVCFAEWSGTAWTLISNDVWGHGFDISARECYAVSCDTDGTSIYLAWGETDGTTIGGLSNWIIRVKKYTPGTGFSDLGSFRRFPPVGTSGYSEIAGYEEGLIIKCSPTGVPWVGSVQWDKSPITHTPPDQHWTMYPCLWYYNGSSWIEAHPPDPVNPWDSHPDFVAPTGWNGVAWVPTTRLSWSIELNNVNIDVQRQIDITFCHHNGPSEYPSVILEAYYSNWNPNFATSGTYDAYLDSHQQQDLGYTYYTFLYSECDSNYVWKAPNGIDNYLSFTSDELWGPIEKSDVVNSQQRTLLGERDMDTGSSVHVYGQGHWQQGISLIDDGQNPILIAAIGVFNWSDSVQLAKFTQNGILATVQDDAQHRGIDPIATKWTAPTGSEAIIDSTGQIYVSTDGDDFNGSFLSIVAAEGGNASIPASKDDAWGPPLGQVYGFSRLAVRGNKLYIFRSISVPPNYYERLVVFQVDLHTETYIPLMMKLLQGDISLSRIRFRAYQNGP